LTNSAPLGKINTLCQSGFTIKRRTRGFSRGFYVHLFFSLVNIRTHRAPYLIIIAILGAMALWLYSKFSATSSAKADLERQSETLRLQTIADEAFIVGAKDSAFSNIVRKETAARRQEREQFERNIAELEARLDETNRALESKSIPIKTLRFKSAKDQKALFTPEKLSQSKQTATGLALARYMIETAF
jgi:hypothetical protein